MRTKSKKKQDGTLETSRVTSNVKRHFYCQKDLTERFDILWSDREIQTEIFGLIPNNDFPPNWFEKNHKPIKSWSELVPCRNQDLMKSDFLKFEIEKLP